MNTDELQKRTERAATETFVIAKTTEGFRVCSPLNPASQYVVTGIPDAPRCTCPDFAKHEDDPEWLCKHVLAVLNQTEARPAKPDTAPKEASTESTAPGNGRLRREKKNENRDQSSGEMVLKRSVSPDGRVNSFSVQFSCPIGDSPAEAVKASAEAALKLQGEIVSEFLKTGDSVAKDPPSASTPPNGIVPARMVKVDGMPTRFGRRLFIAVEVNGATLKLFGTLEQLGEAIRSAGFASLADHIAEGTVLNAACQAVTKPSPNGKYVNVERVLPLPRGNGG